MRQLPPRALCAQGRSRGEAWAERGATSASWPSPTRTRCSPCAITPSSARRAARTASRQSHGRRRWGPADPGAPRHVRRRRGERGGPRGSPARGRRAAPGQGGARGARQPLVPLQPQPRAARVGARGGGSGTLGAAGPPPHRRRGAARVPQRGEVDPAGRDLRGAPEGRGLPVHHPLARARRGGGGRAHVRGRGHPRHHRGRARRGRAGLVSPVPPSRRAHARALLTSWMRPASAAATRSRTSAPCGRRCGSGTRRCWTARSSSRPPSGMRSARRTLSLPSGRRRARSDRGGARVRGHRGRLLDLKRAWPLGSPRRAWRAPEAASERT